MAYGSFSVHEEIYALLVKRWDGQRSPENDESQIIGLLLLEDTCLEIGFLRGTKSLGRG